MTWEAFDRQDVNIDGCVATLVVHLAASLWEVTCTLALITWIKGWIRGCMGCSVRENHFPVPLVWNGAMCLAIALVCVVNVSSCFLATERVMQDPEGREFVMRGSEEFVDA